MGFDSSFVSTVLEPLDVPACRVLMRAFNSLFSAFVLALSSSSAVRRAISVSITIDPSKISRNQSVDRVPLNLCQVGSSFTQTRATFNTAVLRSFRSLPTMSSSRHAGGRGATRSLPVTKGEMMCESLKHRAPLPCECFILKCAFLETLRRLSNNSFHMQSSVRFTHKLLVDY